MNLPGKLLSGLTGALTLTAVHETLRKTQPNAPRMDHLGEQSLVKILSDLNIQPPRQSSTLHNITLASDVVANTLYYSLIPTSSVKELWVRSAGLGLIAGVGALVLPKPLGLNPQESNRTPKTQALTLALYLSGAVVTALTFRILSGKGRGVIL